MVLAFNIVVNNLGISLAISSLEIISPVFNFYCSYNFSLCFWFIAVFTMMYLCLLLLLPVMFGVQSAYKICDKIYSIYLCKILTNTSFNTDAASYSLSFFALQLKIYLIFLLFPVSFFHSFLYFPFFFFMYLP